MLSTLLFRWRHVLLERNNFVCRCLQRQQQYLVFPTSKALISSSSGVASAPGVGRTEQQEVVVESSSLSLHDDGIENYNKNFVDKSNDGKNNDKDGQQPKEDEDCSSLFSSFLTFLPTRYIRESCASEFDDSTYQRNNVTFDKTSGKPIIVEDNATTSTTEDKNTNNDWSHHNRNHVSSSEQQKQKQKQKNRYTLRNWSFKDGIYWIGWGDGKVSQYTQTWIEEQVSKQHWRQKQKQHEQQYAQCRESSSSSSLSSLERKTTATTITTSKSTSTVSTAAVVRDPNRVLWKHLTEEDVRTSSELCCPFQECLSPEGMSHALGTLYKYGILLVPNTPIDDGGSGVAALGAALSGGSVKNSSITSLLAKYVLQEDSTKQQQQQEEEVVEPIVMLPHGTDGPLRTLYGTVWSTTSSGQAEGASVADSAYGCDGLPLHTDMTYLRDPPGLQIFTMVQPAMTGGESVFADGFAIAQQLRTTDPTSFRVLSETIRSYRSIDPTTGWHLQAHGPIISIIDDQISMIRHNDLDRMPDLPPPSPPRQQQQQQQQHQVEKFYHRLDVAHQAWDTLLAKDEFRLVMSLQPGDTVIVANQRCFHGRCSFETQQGSPRSVIGCYISQDELNSRFRIQGYDVV